MCTLRTQVIKDTHVHFKDTSSKGYPCAFWGHKYKRIPMCILRTQVLKDTHVHFKDTHLKDTHVHFECTIQKDTHVHSEGTSKGIWPPPLLLQDTTPGTRHGHRTPSEPWKIQTLTVQFSCSRRRSKFTYGSAQGDRDPRTCTYVKREGFEANL